MRVKKTKEVKKVKSACKKKLVSAIKGASPKPAVGASRVRGDSSEGVDEKLARIRSELKRLVRVEVEAAFNTCLQTMESVANLMESRMKSLLGEVSNLTSGGKPVFKNGKLDVVESADGKERTEYKYDKKGQVTSRTYRSGKLVFEIVHNKYGTPLSGKMFDSKGKVVRSFKYDSNGQVK